MRSYSRRAGLMLAVPLLSVGLMAACTDSSSGSPTSPTADAAPDASVSIAWANAANGAVALVQGSRVLLTLQRARVASITPHMASPLAGLYDPITRDVGASVDLAPVLAGDVVELRAASGAKVGTVTLSLADATATLHAAIDPASTGLAAGSLALSFTFAKTASARFAGFGEQFARVDWAGHVVPVWVRDKGQGRAAQPVAALSGGTETDTWFPMPYFCDPGAGYGFLLTNTEFSQFDLGVTDPASWTVEVWNGASADMRVFAGPTAADVVAQVGKVVGKPATKPPHWAFDGMWLAAQGGTSAVVARVNKAVLDGVPVTAVWSQDWLGGRRTARGGYGVKYHWSVDDTLYPNLAETIADFSKQGVHFLGYLNPFVVQEQELYATATSDGYLPNAADQTIGATYHGGVVDISNPAALTWFQGFAKDAAALGIAGWMADFGEALPEDGTVSGGSGAVLHNTYPVDWAKANRDALAAVRGDDYVVFSRAGFTGAQGTMQILWAGDQGVDWGEDGLRVVVRAGLTSGLSGVLFFTHDIAGFYGGPSTPELYRRWVELGAFTPIMRTHEGELRYPSNAYDSDDTTKAHFVLFTRIHAALAPYWLAIADEAMAAGLPMVRHLSLLDPGWPEAASADDEWALGPDLIFAPVVDEGAQTARVLLPQGDWEHLLTGAPATGRTTLTVDAKVGTPAVFVRTSTMPDLVAKVRALYNANPKDAGAPPPGTSDAGPDGSGAADAGTD